jgi:methionine-S-sulfoxide reductase
MEKVVLAAGCFWGVQHYFDKLPGVIQTTVGYCGGTVENPTYDFVCSGNTGHAEAIEVQYDPDLIAFDTLIKHFFTMHDPTQVNRQGPDVGMQYRSIIFYQNDEQHMTAERVRLEVQQRIGKEIVTEFLPSMPFYPAEEYHQNYIDRQQSHKHCHSPQEHKQF